MRKVVPDKITANAENGLFLYKTSHDVKKIKLKIMQTEIISAYGTDSSEYPAIPENRNATGMDINARKNALILTVSWTKPDTKPSALFFFSAFKSVNFFAHNSHFIPYHFGTIRH